MTSRCRRYAAPLVIALAAMPVRRADAQFISFGVMAGASLSTFTGDLYNDAKNHAGFIAGAFVRVAAVGFAIQPGIYYTAKGVEIDRGTSTSTTSLDYIELPIVLRLHLGPIYAGAGPAIGIRLSCKFGATAAGTTGSADCANAASGFDAKSTEVSGIAEAGLEFGKFSLGGRADLGLSNVFTGPASNVDVKTRTLSVIAAIRF